MSILHQAMPSFEGVRSRYALDTLEADLGGLDEVSAEDRRWWAREEAAREEREALEAAIAHDRFMDELYAERCGQALPDCDTCELVEFLGDSAYRELCRAGVVGR